MKTFRQAILSFLAAGFGALAVAVIMRGPEHVFDKLFGEDRPPVASMAIAPYSEPMRDEVLASCHDRLQAAVSALEDAQAEALCACELEALQTSIPEAEYYALGLAIFEGRLPDAIFAARADGALASCAAKQNLPWQPVFSTAMPLSAAPSKGTMTDFELFMETCIDEVEDNDRAKEYCLCLAGQSLTGVAPGSEASCLSLLL
jgi:hypothetical protein